MHRAFDPLHPENPPPKSAALESPASAAVGLRAIRIDFQFAPTNLGAPGDTAPLQGLDMLRIQQTFRGKQHDVAEARRQLALLSQLLLARAVLPVAMRSVSCRPAPASRGATNSRRSFSMAPSSSSLPSSHSCRTSWNILRRRISTPRDSIQIRERCSRELKSLPLGVGAARVRDLFQQAEKLAPCIIFIDELDALGKARGVSGLAGNDEREQTLNQLLVQMDGFDTRSGVLIMAATNRPEILDPALLRPGRFDRHVTIDRPDIKGREKILRLHAKRLTLGSNVDLASVAAKTPGFAGADLANIVNEAALRAARKNKLTVEMSDFEEAIDRVVAGLEKKNRVMNQAEKETVAHHEAGHALIAESRRTADKVSKISIIPRGIGALGFTQQLPTEDRYLLKYSELLDRLDVLLGGRVAEQLVYGEVSTGAQNDLQRATDMAWHMVTQYGMSPTLGPATLQSAGSPMFLPTETQSQLRGEYSERTAQSIDEEVRRLLTEAEQRVRATLTERRAQLDALARVLLEHETVERSEFLALLGRVSVRRASPAATQDAPTQVVGSGAT